MPQHARVRFEAVYPGIDVEYHGTQRGLEYDFVVAPGADPGLIRLAFAGVDGLRITDTGDLIVRVAGAELRHRRPLIYQEHNGARREIAGRYVMRGDRQVAFEVDGYDPSLPLVIDPVLSYSTYLGNAVGIGDAIAVDAAGNVYIAGSADEGFGTTPGVVQPDYGGGFFDAFVAKLSADGATLEYLTFLGGNDEDDALGMGVDGMGHVYVTGITWSGDFPTMNPAQAQHNGGIEAFVTKLAPDGSSLVYSTYLGGSEQDIGHEIDVDTGGNAYVSGNTLSQDFPTTAGAYQQVNNSSGSDDSFPADAFVTKLNASGAIVYSTYVGGSGGEQESAIAVDGGGAAYVLTQTASSDFPTTPGSAQPSYGGGFADYAIFKLAGDGSALVYSTFWGGSGAEQPDGPLGIAVDPTGHAYVTASTDSDDVPVINAYQPFRATFQDGIVAKVSPTGDQFVYSTYLGGPNPGTPDPQACCRNDSHAIAVDELGSAYVAGHTSSPEFPAVEPLQGAAPPTYDEEFPGVDAFVTKFSPDGSELLFSTRVGGTSSDWGEALAVDADGNAYLTGTILSTDFPTVNALQPDCFSSVACESVFVLKITDIPSASTGAPPTQPTLAVARLDDTNGNGSDEIALMREGSVWVELRDASTGSKLNTRNYFDDGFTPVTLAALDDADGNGVPEVAVLAIRDADGRFAVELRNAAGPQLSQRVWFTSTLVNPKALVVLPDVDGNGVVEYAVLAERQSDQRNVVEVRNVLGPTKTRRIWFAAGFSARDLLVTPDTDGNGVVELAVWTVRDSDQRDKIELRNAFGPTDTRHVWFGSGFTASAMAITPGEPALLALLSTRDSDGQPMVQVKRAVDGTLVRNTAFFDPSFSPIALTALANLDSNEAPELLVLAERGDGQPLTERKNAFGAAMRGRLAYLDAKFTAQALIALSDADGNQVEDVGVLAIRDSDVRYVTQRKNVTGIAQSKNIWFSP